MSTRLFLSLPSTCSHHLQQHLCTCLDLVQARCLQVILSLQVEAHRTHANLGLYCIVQALNVDALCGKGGELQPTARKLAAAQACVSVSMCSKHAEIQKGMKKTTTTAFERGWQVGAVGADMGRGCLRRRTCYATVVEGRQRCTLSRAHTCITLLTHVNRGTAKCLMLEPARSQLSKKLSIVRAHSANLGHSLTSSSLMA